MQRGKDIKASFDNLIIVHHNKPASLVPSHNHSEHHLMIPLQGEFSVELKGQILTCSPGRMIYIPPDTDHAFRSSREKGERLICMINHSLWIKLKAKQSAAKIVPSSQLCKEILFHLLLNPKSNNNKSLITILVQIIDEILTGAIDFQFSIEHVSSKTSRPELLKAIATVAEEFAELPSIAILAKKSGLSERNFSRLFRTEIGFSPKQFLTRVRIEKAKDLLISGSSVTDAAYAVGYQSLSQFILSFRQITGVIPSEYYLSSKNVQKPN